MSVQILNVSRTLNLNEIECVKLVYRAAQELSQSTPHFLHLPAADIQSLIEKRSYELYYQRRYNLLMALMDVILMYQDDTFPSDMQQMVADMLPTMIRTLVPQLLQHIYTLYTTLSTISPHHVLFSNMKAEIEYLLLILLNITHRSKLTGKEMAKVLEFLGQMHVTRLVTRHGHAWYHCC